MPVSKEQADKDWSCEDGRTNKDTMLQQLINADLCPMQPLLLCEAPDLSCKGICTLLERRDQALLPLSEAALRLTVLLFGTLDSSPPHTNLP